MLLEEFLKPRGGTQVELASRMGVPIQRVNTIINGKRGITAETAILLAEALDTTPEFWMGLQADYDLWHALRKRAAAKGKGSVVARKHLAAWPTRPLRLHGTGSTPPLAPFMIRETVESHGAALEACHDGPPTAAARFVIAWTIDTQGEVAAARTKVLPTGQEAVARCLEREIQQMVFPRPLGGSTVEVAFPFVFRPEPRWPR